MKRFNKIAQLYAMLGLMLMPVWVKAKIQVPAVPGLPGSSGATIQSTITSVLTGILLPIAGVVAVFFLILGGFQYMLGGANEDLVKKGKATIKNAVIGLVIIILSYVVITVVVNTLERQYV